MSKKGKCMFFGGFGDAKALLKHQTLVQEFEELQEETDVTKNKLEAAKCMKLTLTAEVRFLRRRYKLLMEKKTTNALQVQKMVEPPNSLEQTKNKEQLLTRKEVNHHRLPPKPELEIKKRRQFGVEIAMPTTSSASNQQLKKKIRCGKETNRHSLTPVSVLDYKGRINIGQERLVWKPPVLDLNANERKQGANGKTVFRQSIVAFDLNQDCSSGGKEAASLPIRTPIFDLNEISTGDEDFQNFQSNPESAKFEEAKKSLLIRGLSDEQQNDLKLFICRNAGEGSSHMGKRKISWQDPIALRV